MSSLRTAALILALATAPAAAVAQAPSPTATFFADWRSFVAPELTAGVPDYSPAAMQRKAAALPRWRTRLAALPVSTKQARTDQRLIGAEINGLDFFLRVLRPWARDPGFYQNVFAEESDVPAHEGPSAAPNIDLWTYHWPLSRADDARLAAALGTVPALLDRARINLRGSNAADLWRYGDRAFAEQADALAALGAGTLQLHSIDGRFRADMTGASPALRAAIDRARVATTAFAAWVRAEAPKKTGPSGVGRENYDWWAKNVALSPYDWQAQHILLQRELDRAISSLRLEEARNRDLPPLQAIEDPMKYRAFVARRSEKFYDFLVANGVVLRDDAVFRAALLAQKSDYTPPEKRQFFDHGSALDPIPLLSHSTHWLELARLKYEPSADPVRAKPPLFNIYADRSEGFATAMEELVMHLGFYDDSLRGREIVWIMLANRAARGLASLRVQANEIDLAEAGRFHAAWTPRGWSDPNSQLVGFEQLLYLRQPGYGASYVVGKMQLDDILARASHAADAAGQPFSFRETWARIIAAGILPPSLIADEVVPPQAASTRSRPASLAR